MALAVLIEIRLYQENISSHYLVCGRVGFPNCILPWYFISVYVPVKEASDVRKLALEDIRRLLAILSEKTKRGPIIAMGDWNMSHNQLSSNLKKWNLPFSVVKCSGSSLSRYEAGNVGKMSALDFVVSSNDGLEHLSKTRVDRSWDLSDHWPVIANIHKCQNPATSNENTRK